MLEPRPGKQKTRWERNARQRERIAQRKGKTSAQLEKERAARYRAKKKEAKKMLQLQEKIEEAKIEQENAETGQRPGKMPPMIGRTKEAVLLVTEHGVEPKKALQIIGNGKEPTRDAVRRLNKHVARWSIERPAAQKIAHSTLLKFASGHAVNGIEPKAVDVRACAERIIDQTTPITRRTESLNINVQAHPVDLADYL